MTTSIFGLITFGGVGIKSSVTLKGERSLEYAAEGATTAAIQAVRYSNLQFNQYPPQDCLPDGAVLTVPDTVTIPINQDQMVVDCAATVLPQGSPARPQDRVIAFYACTQTQLAGPPPNYCYAGNAILSATVDFQDVTSAGVYRCSSTDTTTCGTGENIVSWVIQTSDN